MLLSLLACADSVDNTKESAITVEAQRKCMFSLLGVYDKSDVDVRLKQTGIINRDDKNICHWNSVTCRNAIATAIHWPGAYSIRIAHLAWLPPTMEYVNLRYVGIDAAVCTRSLPAALTHCDVSGCGVFGTVCLTTLPHQMVVLLMRDNNISGKARLTHLPETLRILDLAKTLITRVIVSNERVPLALTDAIFYRKKGKTTVVCLDSEQVSPRVRIEENCHVDLGVEWGKDQERIRVEAC